MRRDKPEKMNIFQPLQSQQTKWRNKQLSIPKQDLQGLHIEG